MVGLSRSLHLHRIAIVACAAAGLLLPLLLAAASGRSTGAHPNRTRAASRRRASAQDYVLHKGTLEILALHEAPDNRAFHLIHIPKTGGSSFLESSPKLMPRGTTLQGNRERSYYQTMYAAGVEPAEPGDVIVLLREPVSQVISQFMECKYDDVMPHAATFPGIGKKDDTFGGLSEWVDHFLTSKEATLGAEGAYNCYNPWNMQTRYLASTDEDVNSKPHFVAKPSALEPPLAVAEKHLDQIGVVGIKEHFAASLCLFEFEATGRLPDRCRCKATGMDAVVGMEGKSLSSKRSSRGTIKTVLHGVPRYSVDKVEESLKQKIRHLVQIDTSLYSHALKRFYRDVESVKDQTGADLLICDGGHTSSS